MSGKKISSESLLRRLPALAACTALLATSPLLAGETRTSTDPQVTALRTLQASSRTKVDVRFRNGSPWFIGGQIAASGTDPVSRANSFLQTYRDLYQLSSPDLALHLRRVNGRSHENVMYYQTYKGLPVFGAELLVATDAENIYAATGNLLTSSASLSTTPGMTPTEAEGTARAFLNVRGDVPVMGETRLAVFDASLLKGGASAPRLAWRVTLGGDAQQVFVDAQNGAVLFNAPMTATSDFDLDLEDANNNSASASNCYWSTTDDDAAADEDEVYDDYANDTSVNNLWHYSYWTYEFYLSNFNRNSYDDDGSQLELYAHTTTKGGASWIGGCDSIDYTDPFIGFDVTAHEMTHGVIQYTSNLTYQGESGAMNESYADVMGALADGNWLVGEGTPNGTLRDMSNPPKFGQPDKYANFVVTSSDNGGVHTNSGIGNKAAYLIANGGTHNGFKITGIGNAKMGQLYYATMTLLLSSSNYNMQRGLTVAVADHWRQTGSNGFNANDVCQVRNAFASVGLGSADSDCDGLEDAVDPDSDNDFIPDTIDNCKTVANPDQNDSPDHDGVGTVCDADDDNDGVPDTQDNCAKANPDQQDKNKNGIGDACEDGDGDGVIDAEDNCPGYYNPSQYDSDYDGEGDTCDFDLDGDGITGLSDNCPFVKNLDQKDTDGDGVGDACDLCPTVADVIAYTTGIPALGIDPKPYQPDSDGDGVPNACDVSPLSDTTVVLDGNLYQWGQGFQVDNTPHQVDMSSQPKSHVSMPIPMCNGECPDALFQNDRIQLTLSNLPGDVAAYVTDETGRMVAKSSGNGLEEKADRLVRFKPLGGHDYRVNFAFKPTSSGRASLQVLSAVVDENGRVTTMPTRRTSTAPKTLSK